MEELEIACLDRYVLRVYTRQLFFYEKAPNPSVRCPTSPSPTSTPIFYIQGIPIIQIQRKEPGVLALISHYFFTPCQVLESSLQTVIQREYKPWLGNVVQIDSDRSVFRYNPTGTQRLDRAVLEGTFDDLRGKDGSFLSIIDDIVVPSDILANDSEAPVLYTALFTFAQGDGCVIAVSLHHHAGDGAAQFSFVKAWCDEAKGATSPTAVAKIHSRTVLPKAPAPPAYPPPAYRYISDRSAPSMHTAAETVLVRFPAKALAEFKAKVAASLSPPLYVSTNDVLLALLFRATTRCQLYHPSSPIFMKFNVDARSRNAGVPLSYAGNATLFSLVEAPNVGELLSAPLSEVALRFRREILAVNQTTVAELHSFVDQFSIKQLHESFFFLPPYLHVSNWDSFGGLGTYDFGSGPCAAIRLPPPGADRIYFVLPSSSGVEVVVGLAPAALARFRSDEELRQAGMEVLGLFQQISAGSQLSTDRK